MPDETKVVDVQVKDFPPDLKRRLKVLAAANDMDMKTAVIEAVYAWCAAKERESAAADRLRGGVSG